MRNSNNGACYVAPTFQRSDVELESGLCDGSKNVVNSKIITSDNTEMSIVKQNGYDESSKGTLSVDEWSE